MTNLQVHGTYTLIAGCDEWVNALLDTRVAWKAGRATSGVRVSGCARAYVSVCVCVCARARVHV